MNKAKIEIKDANIRLNTYGKMSLISNLYLLII